MWIDHPGVLFYAVTKHKVWCTAYIIGQYVVLSSGRKVIFGKWKNLQSPCGHCYRPQTNEESVTSNKGQKWQLNRSVGISTCIWNICMCMCNCAIVHWQCTMAKPACAHDDERQRNVLCHQNVFSTKQTRYCCRAALHLYPFLVFSNENSTSFFFLEPKQKLLSNCTYRKRWNNMRHLESTFVASSPFDTVEISKQNTLKIFLCRFFSITIRPCNNALTWCISHVSVSSVNCDHKSNQWKSNDYSFQAVYFYSIGIVLPFRNLDDYCKSFMLHFLHISAVGSFFRLLKHSCFDVLHLWKHFFFWIWICTRPKSRPQQKWC